MLVKQTIMVADNEEAVFDRITSQLRREGLSCDDDTGVVRVVFADSYDKALKIAHTNFLHLAFVDLMFSPTDSEPNGLTLLATLSEVSPSCRQVLMTRFGQRN